MRKGILAEGEYYHVYNRGVDKRLVFLNNADHERFLFTLFASAREGKMITTKPILASYEPLSQKIMELEKLLRGSSALVEIVCFCLMPNHFHLLLRAASADGVSQFMKRVGDSYTKAFNMKYKRTGVLFGSKYQFIHVGRNGYLIHLSRYIHRNPLDFLNQEQFLRYYWSSYADYVEKNRWGSLLAPRIVLDQFRDEQTYRNYVEGADSVCIDAEYLID